MPQQDALTQLRDEIGAVRRSLDAVLERLSGRVKSHLTIEEVGELVGRSGYTVRRWVSEGKLAAIRVDGTGPRGRLLVPRQELDRLVKDGRGTNLPDAIV